MFLFGLLGGGNGRKKRTWRLRVRRIRKRPDTVIVPSREPYAVPLSANKDDPCWQRARTLAVRYPPFCHLDEDRRQLIVWMPKPVVNRDFIAIFSWVSSGKGKMLQIK